MINRNFRKGVCCILVGIAAIAPLSGCSKSDTDTEVGKDVVICKPYGVKGGKDTIEIILADDGKTIEQYTYRQKINKTTISEGLKELKESSGETYTLKEGYENAVSNMAVQYQNWVAKNTNCPWIKASWTRSPSKYEATLTITMDFTSDNFSPTENTLTYLDTLLPVDYYYNEDEQTIEYTEGALELRYHESGMYIKCKNKTKTYDSTLHAKLITRIKEKNSTSSTESSTDSQNN